MVTNSSLEGDVMPQNNFICTHHCTYTVFKGDSVLKWKYHKNFEKVVNPQLYQTKFSK